MQIKLKIHTILVNTLYSLRIIDKNKRDIKLSHYKSKYRKNNNIKNENLCREYVQNLFIDLKSYTSKHKLPDSDFELKEGDTKIVAFYLPQFHKMATNDKYHGKGFTEWTNVAKAIPQFPGHYQPHIPFDVGFYDLSNLESLKRQVFLAKRFGIYGFCFHYYWFSGKKEMVSPLKLLVENKELDIKFCLNWANENWSCLWDGGNKELIYEQKLNEGDDDKFMDDIIPYFLDERYIKINGCPLFSIYDPEKFPKERLRNFISNMNKRAREVGLPGVSVYLISRTKDFDPEDYGAEGILEYLNYFYKEIVKDGLNPGIVNPDFKGFVLDGTNTVKEKRYFIEHQAKNYIRNVLVGFDNTARKANSGCFILIGMEPDKYKTILKDFILESKKVHDQSHNFVFVCSWNEWAEGSHLEPDLKYGYRYLQSTREALEETR